jgi:hypothetical protein
MNILSEESINMNGPFQYQTAQLTHDDVETAEMLFSPAKKQQVVYTSVQAARILGCSREQIHNLCNKGRMKWYRDSDHQKWTRRFVSENELRRFMDSPESRALYPACDFGRS